MKKIVSVLLVMVVLFSSISAFALDDQVSEDLSVTQGSHSIDGRVSVMEQYQLITNARSVFLYEVNSETLMYSWNPDEKLAPASLVKIMTAILALEKGQLSDSVEVTQNALSALPYDAYITDLIPGEILTLKDLIYCMMVDSGNDAAVVIAEYISGDEQSFVSEMNQKAQELGCTATNFVNCTGLHDDDQFTTARDLTRILAYAIQNPDFCEAFGTVYYTVPANDLSEERNLDTNNFLLSDHEIEIYYDQRVLGSRTGVNEAGERSIATYARSGDLEFIAIIMGSQSEFTDAGYTTHYGGFPETVALLNAGFDGYYVAQVVCDGQVWKQCDVMDGDAKVSLGSRTSFFTVLPQGVGIEDLTVNYYDETPQLSAPIQKGTVLSAVQLKYGDRFVAQAELSALNEVRSQADSEGLIVRNNNESDSGPKIATVLLLLAAFAVIAFIGRYVRQKGKRNSSGNKYHGKGR